MRSVRVTAGHRRGFIRSSDQRDNSDSVASEESQILERASETRTGRCTMAEKESVTIVKQGLLQKRGERSWIIYWLFPLFYRRVH